MEENVISHNLKLMLSSRPGHMRSLDESMGGNAQRHEGHPCIAFPFLYDMQTGRILYFGNLAGAPERIQQEYSSGDFRIMTPLTQDIAECIIETHAAFATTEARENLAETVHRYNQTRRPG